MDGDDNNVQSSRVIFSCAMLTSPALHDRELSGGEERTPWERMGARDVVALPRYPQDDVVLGRNLNREP